MKTNSRIIDISWPIVERMPVYPGNPGVEIVGYEGTTSRHSKISFGSHTGTHVDAPRHVFAHGGGVDTLPLDAMIGPCRVLDMLHVQEKITVQDLQKEDIRSGERILVKTTNSLLAAMPDKGQNFFEDYIYLDGDAADYLAQTEISLFGTDYLSVKQPGSMDNRPHTALLEKEIVIVEGLNLTDVISGTYQLIVLPLRVVGLDGSPARAVLLSDEQ